MMFAIQGIFDKGVVHIDMPISVKNKYDVVVTFIKPTESVMSASLAVKNTSRERKLTALNRITGVLSKNAITLEDARKERLSRQ